MYQLYYYPSNASLAPHMLLEELGVPYQLVLVDRVKNAHKAADYLRLNPTGRIPAFVHGDLVLFEAAAICLHLVDTHPEAGLAPAVGTAERAHFYKWLMYLTNTLQAELITYYYPERLASDETGAEDVKQHAEQRIGVMLDLLDNTLAEHGGPYLLGARYSAVDPYLMMLARWTRGMANPARNRPHLGPFLQRMIERPAISRTLEQEGLATPLF